MRKKIFYIFEGTTLAYSLAKKLLLLGNEVFYISNKKSNHELLDGLKAYHSSFELVYQDPTDGNWIQSLDLSKETGALIILSEDDALNFVICWLLRQFFQKVRIIGLVNNIENEFMFKELNINTLIPTSWMEKIIEATIKYEDITDFFNPYVEKLSIFEILINDNDKSCNKSLKEIKIPDNAIIGVIIKDNNDVMVPYGNTIIENGDKLIIFALKEVVQKTKDSLK